MKLFRDAVFIVIGIVIGVVALTLASRASAAEGSPSVLSSLTSDVSPYIGVEGQITNFGYKPRTTQYKGFKSMYQPSVNIHGGVRINQMVAAEASWEIMNPRNKQGSKMKSQNINFDLFALLPLASSFELMGGVGFTRHSANMSADNGNKESHSKFVPTINGGIQYFFSDGFYARGLVRWRNTEKNISKNFNLKPTDTVVYGLGFGKTF